MTVCRHCGEPVEWVPTGEVDAASGLPVRVPLDVDPPGNAVLDVCVVAGVVKRVPLGGGDRVSHLDSCPSTQRWRDRRDLAALMRGAARPAKPKKGEKKPGRLDTFTSGRSK